MVTVNNLVSGTIAADQTICEGADPVAFTSTTPATGDGTITYQWQDSPDGSTFTDIPLATGATYDAGILTQDAWYRRVATSTLNTIACTATTAAVRVTVNNLGSGTIAGSQTICEGDNPVAFTSTLASTGDGAITYQWESSTTSGVAGFSAIGGATSATYDSGVLTQDTWFRRVATSTLNTVACTATSTAVSVTVNNFTSANTIAADQTICSGTTAALTGNDVTADGTVTYQWQYKTSLAGVFANVPSGGTGRDYTTPALTANTWYQRIATSTLSGTCTLTSNTIKVSVPTITTQPASNPTSCEGVAYAMNIVVDGGSATLNYQWQFSDFDCISGWNDIVGATTASYNALAANLPPLGGTRYFRCIVTIGTPACANLVSDCATVTVVGCNPKIGVAKQLVSMTNNGDGTYEALFNIRVQNYGGTQLDNIHVTDNLNTTFTAGNYAVLGISSANFAVNTSFNGNSDQNLLVSAGNSLERDASSDIRLRVKILSAGSYSNSVTASSSTGSVTDVSQDGSDPDPDHDGNVAEHLTPTPVVTACSPVVSVSANDGVMCHPNTGFTQTFQIVATASNAASYAWTTDGTGSFSNATILTPTYTPSASDVQDGQVRLKIVAKSGGVCPNVEDEMILTIWTPPTVDAGPAATICSGNTHILTGAVAYNYTALVWTTSGDGTFNNVNALNPVYTPGATDRTAGSVTLTLAASAEGTCTGVSDNLVLTITPAPTVSAGADATICSSSATYTLSGSATNYSSLLWTTSGTGTFTGATTLAAVYTPSAADIATGQVQLTLTATGNGSCSSVSDFMVLNIWPAPTANAGPDAAFCSGTSFVLTGATASNYASLTWSVIAGTGTFNNANALNPTFTPTSTGTITLRLTATRLDASCTTATDDISLTVTQSLTLTASSIVNTNCNASVGSVVLTSGDGSTITLNGTTQASGSTFSGLAAGYYTATSNGSCTATTSFNIINTNSTLAATVSFTDVLCNGGTTTATITATGGTGTKTYLLDGTTSNGTGIFSSLSAGEHIVLITDANGCTYSVSFNIDQPTPLTLSLASKTNILCNGSSTGSAIVVASGGTTGYTYSVTAGPNAPTVTGNVITGMIAGTYTIRVTDANGCTADLSVTITQPAAALDITTTAAVLTDPACNGASTGSVNITVTGGTAPYNYAWINGYNGEDLTGVPAGTYTVNVTDANGCTISGGTYTLTNPAAVTLTASSIVNTNCNASVGSVVLTSSDGSTITLNGTTHASGSTFSGISGGYYTATSNGSCTATTSFNIINTNSTLAATVSFTDVLCNGGTTTATVTATGGTGAKTYLLDGTTSNGTGIFAGLSAGEHIVLVTDANGCTYSVSFNIGQPTQLTISLASKTNVLCNGSSTGSAIVVASGGTTGYTYSILSQPAGGTSASISGNVISGMEAGSYTIRVTDANSCTADLAIIITQPASALDITTTAALLTNPACNGASTGSINITVSGGTAPYVYAWSNGYNGQDLANVPAGSYTVNVTDANGCIVSGGTYTLTNPAAVTLTASAIVNTNCNTSVGSVVLTSSDGSTITLNGTTQASGSTFSGLAAGYYTATSNGSCTATTSFNIINTNSTLAATVSFTDVLCNGGTTTATVTATGGTGAKTYLLDGTTSNGTGIFAGLSAGEHIVLVTDANGCTYSVSFNIGQPTQLTISLASKTNVLCNGSSTGSAIVVASGGTTGYTYSILSQPAGGTSASISSNVISGMEAGSYTIRVTDANGCTADLAITITQPVAALDITTTAAVLTDPGCNGASTGSVNITVTGGTPPYVYAWSNGYNGQDLTGVPAGTYTVHVTDANGCTISGGTYTLTNPAAVTLTASSIVNTYCNASVGSVVLTSSDASSITLNGVTHASGSTFSGLSAGYYTATSNGSCTATTSFNIINTNSTLTATVSFTDVLCNGGTTTATVTATGGTGAYTYLLNRVTSNTTGIFSGLSAGGNNVLVTDGNGCTYYLAFDIDQPTPLVLSLASQANVSCYGSSTGSTIVVASGGTTGYTYSILSQPAGGTTASISGNVISAMEAGSYTIRVTDANSCTADLSVTITQPVAALDITTTAAVLTDPDCNGASTGSVDITVAGGTVPYNYAWSNGYNGQDLTGVPAGTYTVNVTDANGCTISGGTYTLANPAAVTLTASSIVNTNCNASVGSIVLTSGDGSTITLNGTTYASGSTFSGLSAGYYTATSNGSCTATTSFNIINTNSTLAATVSFTDVLCNGGTTTATVTATGGTGAYTYLLNRVTSNTTGIFSGLSAGGNNVLVTDGNGCTYYLAFDIDQPTPLVLSKTSQTNVSCQGLANGSVILMGSGGTTGYSYSIVSQPAGGTATVLANVISGMKAGNYTLRVTDAHSCIADLAVTISEDVCQPVAIDDNKTTPEDSPVSGNVLTNDSDPNGLTLTVTQFVIGGTTYLAGTTASISGIGTLIVNSDGTYTFTPVANFNGTVPVGTYTITNGTNTTTANIHITVIPVNDVPAVVDDSYTTAEDVPLTGNLGLNDTRSGDGGNVWTVVTAPSHGTVVINLDGTFTYTPAANYNGSDSFTYKLCDVDPDCATATVSVTVSPVNNPPVIADVPKTGAEDSDITFVPADFTSKFTDIDGNSLTQVQVITLPANGTLKLSGVAVTSGDVITTANIANLTFTPDANWNGSTLFDWNGFDGAAYAVTAQQVNMTVTPVNDPPLAGTGAMPSQMNPGGTNSIQVFANNFSGTDPNDPTGFISAIKITTMPTNATSITVDGITYTSIPVGGISVTTNATGQPLFNISIDPVDGAVTSVLSYFVVDNEGLSSLASGSVTVPFAGLSVTGAVYNDSNGLTDNVVNGVGTNSGGALFVNLVNTLNQVVASNAVAANGTYTFAEADGLTVNTTYKLILTIGSQTIGSTLSAATYPAGVTSTGENIGSGAGNDGAIDGILAVDTNSGSLASANFGISGAMSLSAGLDAAICSTDGTYTLSGTSANTASVLWTTNGTGTFSDATLLNAVYTPSAADIATGEVQLTLSATSVGSIPSLSDMMVLTIWPGATAYAGIDQSVCRGDVYQVLDASVSHAAGILWTVNAGATGTLSGATTLTPVYTPGAGETGVITLTLTVTPEGRGTCANVTDSKTLTITDPPTVVLGPDINNCALNVTTLTATATNYSSLEWTTSGTGTFSSTNTLTTTYTPSVADINYAQVTLRLTARGNGSCTSASDELVLKLWQNTYAYAGNDVTVCNAQPYQVLDAEATDYVSLLWTHNGTGTLTHATTLSPTYTPGSGETGAVTLTLTVIPQGNGTCPSFSDQKVITIGGAPVISCPVGSPFVFGNTTGKCGYVVLNTALDATATGCSGLITVTHNYSAWGNPNSLAGATFPVGITNVVWTAKDTYGNISTCTIAVRVLDNEAPTFVNCSSNTIFEIGLSPDACETGAIWSRPVATDNCSPVVSLLQTKGPAQGSKLSAGTYEIQYTATDDAGNSSVCAFFVKVIDTERPFVVCRPNFEIQADKGTCSWTSPANSVSPLLARSNCAATVTWEIINPDGSISTGSNDASGYTFRKGTSTVKYTNKENLSAQSTSCSFTVTVVDKEAPVITCPGPIVQSAGSGGCDATVSLTAPTYTDVCGGSTVQTSYHVINPDNSDAGPFTAASFTFKAGISRVVWTLTDLAGNSSNCTQQVTINSDASALNPSAGADAVICEGSGYTLSGASATNYTSVKWTSEGSGKFDNAASLHPVYTPSLADIINGQAILKLTASSACASSSSSMTLIINRNSVVRAGAAKDAFICEGSTFTLSGAMQTNATSIKWTTSGTGSFANAADLNTTYQPSAADFASGMVILTITGKSASPCGKSSDTLILHLVPQATANAGTDASICEGSVYTMSGANATNYTSLSWTSTGSGKFDNASGLHPTYTPSLADILNGQVELRLTASSACANSSASMTLTISRKSIVKAGIEKDAFVCEGSTFTLSGAVQTNTTSIEWTTSGTGSFANATELTATYKPSAADIAAGSVVLTISGQSASPCGKSSDTLILHMVPQATANAGADATICEGSTFDLSSATASYSSALLWKTSGTGTFSDPKALHPTYFPSASDIANGIAYLTLTAIPEYPCSGTQDELVLTISRTPKINAGIDLEACAGDIVKIGGATAQNVFSTNWVTDGKGTLSGGNTLHPTYKPASGESGTLQFILTAVGSDACNSLIVKDTLILTYHDNLEVTIMAADTILYNTAATLNVSGNKGTGNYIYRWEPSNLVPNFTSNRTQTLPLTESTLFTVTISDVHTGCFVTDQVMITVEKEVDNLLEFYNGLSPNGDGNNDVWWIDGIEKFPENDVLIFNRWGDKIIELKNYDNIKVVWDGKNTYGKMVPDGTYYYVAKIRNVKSYTGWINLRSGR